MALKLKILNATQLDTGNVITFQGLDESNQVLAEANLNFPKRFTQDQIIEACMETIEDAVAEASATAPDLSALVATEITIDPDRRNPLNGVTDGPTAKVICEKAISERFESMVDTAGLISKYGPVERDTWAQQIEAALNYQAGDPVAFIANATDTDSGETGAELAAKILANADAFLDAFGSVVLTKRKLTNALTALPDDAVQVKAFYDNHVATWSL